MEKYTEGTYIVGLEEEPLSVGYSKSDTRLSSEMTLEGIMTANFFAIGYFKFIDELKTKYSYESQFRILNIGSGFREINYLISKNFPNAEIVSIDGLPWSRQVIPLLHNEVYIQCDFESMVEMPFSENEFDYVISSEVIEHLELPTSSKFIKDSYRVLKPGGVFFNSMPSIEKVELRLSELAVGHLHLWMVPEFIEFQESVGFKECTSRTYSTAKRGKSLNSMAPEWKEEVKRIRSIGFPGCWVGSILGYSHSFMGNSSFYRSVK